MIAFALVPAAGAATAAQAGSRRSLSTDPLPVDLNGTYTVYSGACPAQGSPIDTWTISAFEGAWPSNDFNGIATFASTSIGSGGIAEYPNGGLIVNTSGSTFNLTLTASSTAIQMSSVRYCAINSKPQSLSSLSTISGTMTKNGKPFGPGATLDFDEPSLGPYLASSRSPTGTYEFFVSTPPVRYYVGSGALPKGQGTMVVSTCAPDPPDSLAGPTICNVELLPKTPPNTAKVNFVWVGGPKLVLKASNPTRVNSTGSTALSLKAQVTTTPVAIAGASLKVQLLPKAVVPKTTTLTATVGSVPGSTTKTVAVTGGQLTPTVIGEGDTLGGMNSWANANPANKGWHNQAMPTPHWGGGRLVYSDYPEFLDKDTQVGPTGLSTGANVEGILYKQGPGTYAAFRGTPVNEQFRLFFNHENRTGVAKQICLVFQATAPGETVSIEHQGIAKLDGSDPVRIGRDAVAAYYASGPGGPISIATTVSGKSIPVKAYCPPNGALGTATGAGSTGIIDYKASGSASVSVGVVVLNAGDAAKFVLNPLGYHFATKSKTPYTYASGPDLYNFLEQDGHVAGTFLNDTLTTEIEPCDPSCKPYDEGSGNIWGAVILGDPDKALPVGAPEDKPEYQESIDTHKYNIGNYGVQYVMTIPTTGISGEVAQVLLDDRGLGANGVNNAFADVVQADGSEIYTPVKGQPGVGDTGNLLSPDYGVGVGTVDALSTFRLSLIPAAGSTFPLGIVLAPAYLEMNGTLTYGSESVDATPNPTFVTLAPASSAAVSAVSLSDKRSSFHWIAGGH